MRKCSYCDFYSVEDLGLKPAFLAALQAEIASAHADGLVFDTIYIGGGTPSTLEPAEVGRIVESLAARFRFEGAVEVTLEANPGTVGPDKLKGFRAAGVNRLTIGVQSFDPGRLDLLGRIHTSVQAERAVADARAAGFDEIDIDLIYGLPGQTASAWTDDLERALAHNPEHLSCYMLIIEPGTPMARMRDSGRLRPPPDDQVAELFVLTSELLTGRGYRHYEIANFARCDAGRADAHVSRHNSKYWSYAPYLGFGPAAHSFLPPRRFWNERNLAGYVEAIGAGGAPPTRRGGADGRSAAVGGDHARPADGCGAGFSRLRAPVRDGGRPGLRRGGSPLRGAGPAHVRPHPLRPHAPGDAVSQYDRGSVDGGGRRLRARADELRVQRKVDEFRVV